MRYTGLTACRDFIKPAPEIESAYENAQEI